MALPVPPGVSMTVPWAAQLLTAAGNGGHPRELVQDAGPLGRLDLAIRARRGGTMYRITGHARLCHLESANCMYLAWNPPAPLLIDTRDPGAGARALRQALYRGKLHS
jgi:hypothetical protein